MSSHSRVIIAGAVLAGFLILLVCTAIFGVAGYLWLTHQNPLSAFAPSAQNQIVYIGNDLNLYVVDPDGGHQYRITTDGDGGNTRRYDFPTWSPDSRHIAFVGIENGAGGATNGTLFSAEPTGGNRRTLYQSDQSIPFYLYWAPDSRHLSFLTNKTQSTLSLEIATEDGGDAAKELDSGAPLYWAWSPDARNMFLHIGGTRNDSDTAHLALLPVSHPPAEAITPSPGQFQAPQWSGDGESIFYSQQEDNGKQSLMIADARGKNARLLVQYDGRIAFAVSPRGDRVAYIATPSDIQLPTLGEVHVIGVDGKNDQGLGNSHALALIWSPDGNRIAYLSIPTGGSTGYRFKGQAQTGTNISLRWDVFDFDSHSSHTLAQFTPTDSFLNTVPFFDQYTRSATFWSPDSEYLVYSSADTADKGSIWVADVTGSVAPRRVADGQLAYWSWK